MKEIKLPIIKVISLAICHISTLSFVVVSLLKSYKRCGTIPCSSCMLSTFLPRPSLPSRNVYMISIYHLELVCIPVDLQKWSYEERGYHLLKLS